MNTRLARRSLAAAEHAPMTGTAMSATSLARSTKRRGGAGILSRCRPAGRGSSRAGAELDRTPAAV
jgi:hypothetical protein